MTRVFVGVGSNIDRDRKIEYALAALTSRFGPLDVSPTYESQALNTRENAYFNLVVGFDSDEIPANIYAALKSIEHGAGRERDAAACALDLDLLTCGDAVLMTDRFTLPREDIVKYAFVLRPLADLAPDEYHPELRRSYAELWDAMAPRASGLVEVRPGATTPP